MIRTTSELKGMHSIHHLILHLKFRAQDAPHALGGQLADQFSW